MASPFNVPDEFVQGFYKSGQSLVHAFAGLGVGSTGSPARAPATVGIPARPWRRRVRRRWSAS